MSDYVISQVYFGDKNVFAQIDALLQQNNFSSLRELVQPTTLDYFQGEEGA